MITYRLAEKFHKLPHEIRAMPWRDVQYTLMVMDIEGKVNKAKRVKR